MIKNVYKIFVTCDLNFANGYNFPSFYTDTSDIDTNVPQL